MKKYYSRLNKKDKVNLLGGLALIVALAVIAPETFLTGQAILYTVCGWLIPFIAGVWLLHILGKQLDMPNEVNKLN